MMASKSCPNRPGDQGIHPSSVSTQPWNEVLTTRELEVLILLAQRLSNKEIGEKLFISPDTVKRHTVNIYSKINVHTRQEAVAKARDMGILSHKR